jgi:hypothetical protein
MGYLLIVKAPLDRVDKLYREDYQENTVLSLSFQRGLEDVSLALIKAGAMRRHSYVL